MKAVVLHEHGAGGLRYETDFPDPVPGAGDVALRVRAASLNYHDVFTRGRIPEIRIPMSAILRTLAVLLMLAVLPEFVAPPWLRSSASS